jgi:hypothetical protein
MLGHGFPYRPDRSHQQHLKPVKLEDEGSEGKIPPFAWMSDGAVRPIERGLPVLEGLPSALDPVHKYGMESLISLLVDKPYLKAFHRTYGALESAHPDFDVNDPDMMSHYEKQLIAQYAADSALVARANELKVVIPGTQTKTTKIPLDAHLHTWGGAIPYVQTSIFPEDDVIVAETVVKPRRAKTGIHGDANSHAEDQSSIIRPVKFATLKEAEARDRALSRDSAISPVIFAPSGKRTQKQITRVPGHAPDPTVRTCIKRFFDPGVGVPFIPADIGTYFPIDLLTPEEVVAPVTERDEIHAPPPEEPEMKSALIDTSNDDVLFTKNKAPFTRDDISTLRAF